MQIEMEIGEKAIKNPRENLENENMKMLKNEKERE
jgi:hypothetical protein